MLYFATSNNINMRRLDVLNNRYERIIELNNINRYTSSLAEERKRKQYYNLLLEIKKQKYIWIKNNTNCEQVKQAVKNMI